MTDKSLTSPSARLARLEIRNSELRYRLEAIEAALGIFPRSGYAERPDSRPSYPTPYEAQVETDHSLKEAARLASKEKKAGARAAAENAGDSHE
jgi:hypothetical protein